MGRYTCAARGPDGRFWFFDDAREPVPVRNLTGYFEKNVDALIYTTGAVARGEVRGAERTRSVTETEEVGVARQLEAMRGLGVAQAPKPGDAVRPASVAERAHAVIKCRRDAGKTWRGRTFESWLCDDEEEAKQLLDVLRPEEDSTQRALRDFEDWGRVYDLRMKDFEERTCLLYTSPSPRDRSTGRMPASG